MNIFRLNVLDRVSRSRVFDEQLYKLLQNKIIKFSVYLSAGHHPKVDNLPPKASNIITKILEIIRS